MFKFFIEVFITVRFICAEILAFIGLAVLAVLLTASRFIFYRLIMPVYDTYIWFKEYKEFKLVDSSGRVFYARDIDEAVYLTDLCYNNLKMLKKHKTYHGLDDDNQLRLVNDNGTSFVLL